MRIITFLLALTLSSCYIVCDKDEWVRRMEKVANQRSEYKAVWPFNVLLWDGTKWFADCSNLQKALFNGRDVYNPAKGSYQRDLSNTGDVTPLGLFNQCADRSSDFSQLTEGEPRILYLDGHIGAYIGKEVNRGGKIYNVIECTAAWEHGILYSYVDEDGRRLRYKGGPQKLSWTGHGLASKWIEY